MAADEPLSLDRMHKLLQESEPTLDKKLIRTALEALQQECEGRSVELREVASGFRYQVRQEHAVWVSRLWEERAPRYSRALMETLSLIAYRQPVTRGDIEDVRGVAVSSHIIKTLLERDWIQVIGHREVPGRPSLYATTRTFLDYFNLKSLDELPSLKELQNLGTLHPELGLMDPDQAMAEAAESVALESDSEAGQTPGGTA
ncbi:unnamed protein product [Cyprideis torosa]|uniref:Uncharacterized protein n=1 Tax=Cyprideis torosa TaxID=163714 RepID=A0A7R8ZUQ6_9CRUS|nr:unnamed protein product [Cyprideis torosa]CAG0909886.1 unnamed protein product [Cyprideis torosa]